MLLVTFFKILEWLGGFRLILKFIIYTNVIKREEVIVRIRGNLRNCLTDLDDPLTVRKSDGQYYIMVILYIITLTL